MLKFLEISLPLTIWIAAIWFALAYAVIPIVRYFLSQRSKKATSRLNSTSDPNISFSAAYNVELSGLKHYVNHQPLQKWADGTAVVQ